MLICCCFIYSVNVSLSYEAPCCVNTGDRKMIFGRGSRLNVESSEYRYKSWIWYIQRNFKMFHIVLHWKKILQCLDGTSLFYINKLIVCKAIIQTKVTNVKIVFFYMKFGSVQFVSWCFVLCECWRWIQNIIWKWNQTQHWHK